MWRIVVVCALAVGCKAERETYPGGNGGTGGGTGGTSTVDARGGGDAAEAGRVVVTPCLRASLRNDAACDAWPTDAPFEVAIADLTLTTSGTFSVASSTSPRVLIADPTGSAYAPSAIIVPPGDGVLDLPLITTARLEATRAASALGAPGSATVVARAIAEDAAVDGVFGSELDGIEAVYPTDDDDTFLPGLGSDAGGTIVWLGLAPGAPTISIFSDVGDASALVPAVTDGVTFVDVPLE